MSAAREIPDAVRHRQAIASDPTVAAFVAANAGSGKTHVLAQRVIRLMLDGGHGGVDPSKILCITFTKAAAANMAARVYDTLRGWIALDDRALDDAMRKIGITGIDAAKRARARRLFAAALETPGGLKVQTIHAFCTRTLQQFPFEANVAARFAVLEDRAQSEMLERATLGVLTEAAAAPASALGRALKTAVAAAADTTLRDVVREAIGLRNKIECWIAAAGSVAAAIAELASVLGVDPDDDLARVEAEMVEGPLLPSSAWQGVAALCREGSKSDQDQARRLSQAMVASGHARLTTYLDVFMTRDGKPRAAVITKALAARFPDVAQRLLSEQVRLDAMAARRNGVICRDRSAALITVAVAVMARYAAEKDRRGLLDYDDLIVRTVGLLSNIDPSWVHYKLDLGLDHVLIDEAQDTSEAQWDIIKRLVSEFGAGAGVRGLLKRTVFAVGDEKQSIFSFQGAAPQEYDTARRHFENMYVGTEVDWRFVRFDHSFRSGSNVLGAVDAVFSSASVYRSITTDRDGMAPHLSLPGAAPGLVEIWPLIEAARVPEMEAWDAPFDAVPETSPQARLARMIAEAVRRMIAEGSPVGHDRERRPMRAGDVLVLVRQRGALFESIIRALKHAGVAVAGADRLVLAEHIAVVDLLALADALLLPQDDLALAVALKSPLFGVDDDALFDLAWQRRGSLRETLAARAAENPIFASADALLRRCTAAARHHTPFGFFAWLLGPERGRCRIFARLGLEAADALDEFLALALDYERREIPSLQGFTGWLRAAATVIKRDMEITRDEVRVMTVHGAKGLEAPVVILADTTTPPQGSHPPRLLEVHPVGTTPGAPACIVWAGRRDDDVEAVARARQKALDENENEHRRLLYVAMTRAAERLIVCGYQGKTGRRPGCWYDLLTAGLDGQPGFDAFGEGDAKVWRYQKVPQPAEVGAPARPSEPAPIAAVPAWLKAEATPEPLRPVALSPSAAYDEGAAPIRRKQQRQDARQALAKGSLIHRLMQSLPDVAPERREDVARRFLSRSAARFDQDARDGFLAQVLAILADRRFAALFGAGSRAEVPLVGRLRRPGREVLVSGQVDRLVVTPQAVLIADYKTNLDPPDSPAAVPPAYVQQLALYRGVLAAIYPDRPVRAAVVWTDRPDLMEISSAMLDQALDQLFAGITPQ